MLNHLKVQTARVYLTRGKQGSGSPEVLRNFLVQLLQTLFFPLKQMQEVQTCSHRTLEPTERIGLDEQIELLQTE